MSFLFVLMEIISIFAVRKTENMKNWRLTTNNTVLEMIGKELKERRVRLNYSQKEVAEIMGNNVSTIQQIEKGKPVSTLTFVGYLRVVDLLPKLDLLFPEEPINPFLLEKLKPNRKRGGYKKEPL